MNGAFNRPDSWGNAGDFHCVACACECSGIGGSVQPKGHPAAMALAVCRSCWERMAIDKAYKLKAQERAADLARPVLFQHLADMLGVSMAQMLEAICAVGPRWSGIDNLLGKPLGSTDAALAQLFAEGTL